MSMVGTVTTAFCSWTFSRGSGQGEVVGGRLPERSSFVLNTHGRLGPKSWLVSWKCPPRSARKSTPEVLGEDGGVVSHIQRP